MVAHRLSPGSDPAPLPARQLGVPIVHSGATAGDIRQELWGRQFESISAIVVLDDHSRVIGIVRSEDLLPAPDATPATALMDADPPLIRPGEDELISAWRAVQHREASLVEVDSDGGFLGVVPPQQLMAVLLAQHERDLSRLAGVIHDSSSARLASYESVLRRFWHRIPWLLLGLAGALAAAAVVSSFERYLERNVMLAFFVPSIVYLADAVGTQTETLVVRGFSLGVGVRSILRAEAVTGLLIGLVLAAVAYPVARLLWGDERIAATLALAVVAACSLATFVALALPGLLRALGLDPAYGSGPVATVVQDISSIAIYFSIAVVLGV